MKAAVAHSPFWKTEINALPFINQKPSNPSTIYSALKFAASECSKLNQRSCFVTSDRPLYAKAVEIVALDTSGVFQDVYVRLGGFHMLVSFLGGVGHMMSGSNIEDLWATVYAKKIGDPYDVRPCLLQVGNENIFYKQTWHRTQTMFNKLGFCRSFRAHLLTYQVLGTILIEKLNDEMASDKSALSDLFLSDSLTRLRESLDRILNVVSKKSRTAKLWVEYFQRVSCFCVVLVNFEYITNLSIFPDRLSKEDHLSRWPVNGQFTCIA